MPPLTVLPRSPTSCPAKHDQGGATADLDPRLRRLSLASVDQTAHHNQQSEHLETARRKGEPKSLFEVVADVPSVRFDRVAALTNVEPTGRTPRLRSGVGGMRRRVGIYVRSIGCLGFRGHGRNRDPAVCEAMREVGVEPLGEVMWERGEDDLVELAVVERLLDRVERVVPDETAPPTGRPAACSKPRAAPRSRTCSASSWWRWRSASVISACGAAFGTRR